MVGWIAGEGDMLPAVVLLKAAGTMRWEALAAMAATRMAVLRAPVVVSMRGPASEVKEGEVPIGGLRRSMGDAVVDRDMELVLAMVVDRVLVEEGSSMMAMVWDTVAALVVLAMASGVIRLKRIYNF